MVVIGRPHQCRKLVVRRRVDVRLGSKQHFDAGFETGFGASNQRTATPVVGRLHVAFGLDEQLEHLVVAVLRRPYNSSVAVLLLCFYVGFGF